MSTITEATAASCLATLRVLRKYAIEPVKVPQGCSGEWKVLPSSPSLTSIAKEHFPGVGVSTVGNWRRFLATVRLTAATAEGYCVRVDVELTAQQLCAILNGEAELPQASQPDDQDSGSAAEEPAAAAELTAHEQVTDDATARILGLAEQVVRLLQELQDRRLDDARHARLRAQLAALQEENEQLKAQVAELTAELELARTVPTVPPVLAQMAARVEGLLKDLSAGQLDQAE